MTHVILVGRTCELHVHIFCLDIGTPLAPRLAGHVSSMCASCACTCDLHMHHVWLDMRTPCGQTLAIAGPQWSWSSYACMNAPSLARGVPTGPSPPTRWWQWIELMNPCLPNHAPAAGPRCARLLFLDTSHETRFIVCDNHGV